MIAPINNTFPTYASYLKSKKKSASTKESDDLCSSFLYQMAHKLCPIFVDLIMKIVQSLRNTQYHRNTSADTYDA